MVLDATAGLPEPHRRPLLDRITRHAEPYLYSAPALILIVTIMLVPLVLGLSYAFRDVQLLNPFSGGFVGLDHFRALYGDDNFYRALRNTLWWTGASVFLQFVFGLILALLLDRPFAGRAIVQALVFLPWAVPTFLTGLNWAWLFNPVIGPLPHWLYALGLMSEPANILSDPQLAMWGPIVANVWWGIPFFAITLLAALQAIPRDLYEAAAIDGAGAVRRFTSITLPFLAPTIAITVLLRTVWISNFADLIIVMTNGGPADRTQIVASYIFTQAFKALDFGYASAIALVLLVLLLAYSMLIVVLRQVLMDRVMNRYSTLGTVLHRLAILCYVAFALFPLFWLLKVSVTPNDLLYSEGVRLWPSRTSFEHFRFVLAHSAFPIFFRNSMIVSGATAVIVTLLASLSGYALSRFNFRGKYWLVALMLLTQMFPLVMLVAPIFKMLSPLGLTNSLTGLVIVYTAFNIPFATFLMQSFFDGIPKELEEAAMIDGATQFMAFRQIILPLTLPGIAATLGFVFTAAWSELLFALMLISGNDAATFPVGLLTFVSKFSVDFGQMMAAGVLALIPACLFFLFIQRYLVQGLTAGAVKG